MEDISIKELAELAYDLPDIFCLPDVVGALSESVLLLMKEEKEEPSQMGEVVNL